EHGDRPRTHREHVAENPADTGRGALIRLDRRGMVVRLDLEGDGKSVADGYDAGVLTRPLQHVRRTGGKRLEEGGRGLVGTVFAPERADDSEFGEGRLATEHFDEAFELARGETVFGDERRSDQRVARPRFDLPGKRHQSPGFFAAGLGCALAESGLVAGLAAGFTGDFDGVFAPAVTDLDTTGGAALGALFVSGLGAIVAFGGDLGLSVCAVESPPLAAASSEVTMCGELLVPVYRRAGERNTASTTLPLSSTTRSSMPQAFSQPFL